jgi:hypothetical protein
MDKRKLLALWLLLGPATGCLESLREGIDENVPPTANAGDDRTVAFEGREVTVTLDGSASRDIDGKIVRYIWRNGGRVTATDVFDGGTGDGGAGNGVLDGGGKPEGGIDEGSGDEAGVADSGLDKDGSIDGGASGEGAPEAEDVVKPEVILTEGVYTFLLWVTDDDGATSAPDTVVITVGGADAGPDSG